MREITATELARNLSQLLDLIEFKGEEIVVTRNQHSVARLLPGLQKMRALEALADLYHTLPEEAGTSWTEEGGQSRNGSTDQTLKSLRNPWDS